MSTIVSLLPSSSERVLVELARAGWLEFCWFNPPRAETIAALAALGAGGETLLIADRPAELGDQAALAGLARTHLAPIGAPYGRSAEVEAAALRALDESIRLSRHLIDELERVHARDGISAILLNETESRGGRIPARWARANGVPVFMLTHGANLNRYYTCTAGVEADTVFVEGARGVEVFLDQDEPRPNLSVTGSPDWDRYATLRANRAAVRERMYTLSHFRPDEPLVLFATTWSAKLSAFNEPGLFERTLAMFFAACARLRQRGVRFNALVKARPMNANAEAAITELAFSTDFTDFAFTSRPVGQPVTAADVVVGVDTSVFVEAMLLGTPSINIWAEPSWIFGPPFAADDAVPFVMIDDVDALADALGRLIEDPRAYAAAKAAVAAGVDRLAAPVDGRAAVRIATEIARTLPPPAARWSAVEAPGRDAFATAYLRPHQELVNAIVRPPHTVLVCDSPNDAVAGALRERFPDARVLVDESAGVLAQGGIDTVLLPETLHRALNPWRLLQEIRSTLPPDGQLLATVWNLRNLWTLADLAEGTARYRHEGPLALEHLRWFTLSELQVLFREAGFGSVRIDGLADPRSHAFDAPPAGATFDLDLDKLTLRGVTTAAFSELRTARYLVTAAAQVSA